MTNHTYHIDKMSAYFEANNNVNRKNLSFSGSKSSKGIKYLPSGTLYSHEIYFSNIDIARLFEDSQLEVNLENIITLLNHSLQENRYLFGYDIQIINQKHKIKEITFSKDIQLQNIQFNDIRNIDYFIANLHKITQNDIYSTRTDILNSSYTVSSRPMAATICISSKKLGNNRYLNFSVSINLYENRETLPIVKKLLFIDKPSQCTYSKIARKLMINKIFKYCLNFLQFKSIPNGLPEYIENMAWNIVSNRKGIVETTQFLCNVIPFICDDSYKNNHLDDYKMIKSQPYEVISYPYNTIINEIKKQLLE